jgi:hypothetical protein
VASALLGGGVAKGLAGVAIKTQNKVIGRDVLRLWRPVVVENVDVCFHMFRGVSQGLEQSAGSVQLERGRLT